MGAYDRYIDRLTADPRDRAALRAVADEMDANPMLAGRAEAVLRELARPAPETHADGREFTGEDCLAYAGSFMEAIGIPGNLASVTLQRLGEVDFDAVSTEMIEDAGLIQHVESAMRDDPDGYARNPDAQTAYAEALARLNTPAVPNGTMVYNSNDSGRRAEIEALMREDGGRKYWNDQAVRREYSQILQRQTTPAAGYTVSERAE
jgi:hypothetical protein